MMVLIVSLLLSVAIIVSVGLYWYRVLRPRQQRAAAQRLTEVQLQLLTQAALTALYDRAREALLYPPRPQP